MLVTGRPLIRLVSVTAPPVQLYPVMVMALLLVVYVILGLHRGGQCQQQQRQNPRGANAPLETLVDEVRAAGDRTLGRYTGAVDQVPVHDAWVNANKRRQSANSWRFVGLPPLANWRSTSRMLTSIFIVSLLAESVPKAGTGGDFRYDRDYEAPLVPESDWAQDAFDTGRLGSPPPREPPGDEARLGHRCHRFHR